MGLFGGGNSRNETINEDNRVINDNSGANFDYTQSHDNGIDGNNNNNQGTINISEIDGGAFDVVSGVSADAMLLADSVVGGAFDVVSGVSADAMLLADSVVQQSDSMLDSSLSYGQSVFSDVAALTDNVSERGLDAALSVHGSALAQIESGNDLAVSLAELNSDASFEQQKDNNNALNNGFQSMMQFAENFSRSDGAAVAETNMKVVGIIALGGVLVAFFLRSKK